MVMMFFEQAVAESIGVPLHRRVIGGRCVRASLCYAATADDEVEDLYAALKDAKEAYPDAVAVSSGAIMSTYQKNRVDNVCARLGLASVAPLWQRDQHELFREMILGLPAQPSTIHTENEEDDDTGVLLPGERRAVAVPGDVLAASRAPCAAGAVDALVIKVAAAGLDGRHLGKRLREIAPDLFTLHQRYGLHLCGEGGEYETLVLDAPIYTKRIVLDETEVVVHSDDAFAPVSYLIVKRFHLEEKLTTEHQK
eukprot:TRINITY_DN1765_c3_g1_i2.p1 TRINITY_DN1765_c3_g1~~TRINITY_DN1765_c3_g1_i2.p1  ORF type:complete len:253 (+),score=22.74 TRINITY_DN1765_c3_g1_i2:278-1036(+)